MGWYTDTLWCKSEVAASLATCMPQYPIGPICLPVHHSIPSDPDAYLYTSIPSVSDAYLYTTVFHHSQIPTCTPQYPIGPRNRSHSSAMLFHFHSNRWVIATRLPWQLELEYSLQASTPVWKMSTEYYLLIQSIQHDHFIETNLTTISTNKQCQCYSSFGKLSRFIKLYKTVNGTSAERWISALLAQSLPIQSLII